MYGLWLFKEIETEYGYCKVEIFRRGYNGSQIEIGALAANSLTLSLENLGEITAPIGKSVCSFEIIDTDQVNYDDFFTPDATAYKVVVSSRVGSGAYVTRWSGYITPDFFAENLSYRTPISISARDNIGYLNDVDFDLDTATITVRELIQAAFRKIAEDYPMNLEFVTAKQTAEGILAIDATISTLLLKEMSWGEALETILHDLGLQVRWVDNNTIAVLDLSQIPEYYATQGFNFIQASGYREIAPAWRQLSQSQDYGLIENFYNGYIDTERKLEYAKTSAISTNILLYQPIEGLQWKREGAIYFLNFFNDYNGYVDDNKQNSIYITGVAPSVADSQVLKDKMVYSQRVTAISKQIKVSFSLNDTLRQPRASMYSRGEGNSIFYLPYSQSSGVTMLQTPHPYQLKYRFNVFLRADDGSSYVMREDWVADSAVTTDEPFIEFKTEKLQIYNSGITDGQGNARFKYTSYNNEEEYSIIINSIPKSGTLEFVVYPYTFVDDNFTRDEAVFQRGAKISDITFHIEGEGAGVDTRVMVNSIHNVKGDSDYQFGQVPQNNGDLLLYAGGLFYSDTLTAINGFQRNAEGSNYNLLELVGRELIHYNKDNYNRLSGTIKNLDKEPLMFNRLFIREGKTYYPYNCSLNIISNEMNITTMQEVEPYETASFTEINSELVTGGGATIGGGNNTILQYSEDAGNAKRVYELQAATEAEKEDGYVLIDNAGFPEAKKVHISEITGLDKEALEQYLQSGYFTGYKANDALMLGGQKPEYYATYTALTDVTRRVTDLEKLFYYDEEHDAVRTSMSLIIDKWITFGGIGMGQGTVTGATELDGLNDVQITRPEGGQVLMYDEDLGLWVNKAGGGVSGDYLPLSGGTIEGKLAVRDKLLVNTTDDYNYGLVVGGGVFWRGPQFGVYEHGGNIDWLDATPNSANAWNNTAWNSLRCQTSSNVLAVIVNAIAGDRKAYIQVGDAEVAKSNLLGSLHLNPYGGTVYIGKNEAIHSGNIGQYITGGGDTSRFLLGYGANSFNANYIYNFEYRGISLGENLPSTSQYGSLLTLPYRATVGNSIPDYATQIFIPNGDDATPYMWFRTSLKNTWNSWRKVVSEEPNGNVLIGTAIDSGKRLKVSHSGWENGLALNSTETGGGASISFMMQDVQAGCFGLSGSKRYEFNITNNGVNTIVMQCDANGNFTATGALTFKMASDRRLKDNIKPLTIRDTMRVLHRLKPVSFEWNEIAFSLDNTKEGLCDGFLADEYEKLIPNSGRDIWGKYRAIDYTRAIPYLAKGWQIHESELDKMRKKVKTMEKEIAQLKKTLNEHNITAA